MEVIKINGNLVPNFVQNLFWNSRTFPEQPLLQYIIATLVCSECDIFVFSVCTGNWCIFIMCVRCAKSNITCLYVIPVDYHIFVSVCCTLHVPKPQCMQQLMYNCSVMYASVTLEVQLLALWVIENLWLTVSRQQRHFVTTRSLTVYCISVEATTNSQTWCSQ